MITFKTLRIKNFLSFGNKITEINLEDEMSTLVVGQNLDLGDAGESTNGVGKTTAFQALTFALYGKGFDKLKTDDFINLVNEKNLLVELELNVDGKDYRITRQRKPNSVELFSGDTNLTLDSMANTDKAIVELIHDVPHHVFLGIFALTPHLDPFMAMSTPDQRNFIESILSLDVLAKRAEKLKVIRKEQQVDIKITEEKLATVRQNNEKTEAQIQKISLDAIAWEDQQQFNLDTLEEKISNFTSYDEREIMEEISTVNSLRDEIVELTKTYNKNKQSILTLGGTNDLERTISDIKEVELMIDSVVARYEVQISAKQTQYENLIQQYGSLDYLNQQNEKKIETRTVIDGVQRSLADKNADLKQQKRLLNDYRKQLDALVQETDTLASGECPYCKQSHFDHDKVDANIQKIEHLENEIKCTENVIENVETIISELESQLETHEIDDTDYSALISKIGNISYQLTHDKNSHESNLENYQSRLRKLCDNRDPEDVILDLSVKIAEKKSEIANKHADLSALEQELYDKQKLLTELENKLTFTSIEQYHIHVMKYEKLIEEKRKAVEQTNPFMSKIETLESTLIDETILSAEYEEAVKMEKHTGYLIKLLTDPKSFIRKNILDQYIPVLNKKILENSSELGLGHICKINSDLSVDVTYMSRSVSYYNLSQGERLRLNLAVSSAFRHLMSLLGKSSNLIMVDEYLDSALDASGMRKAFNFIKKQSKSVWIISHKDELKGHTDRVMTVTKQNGFSSISLKQG